MGAMTLLVDRRGAELALSSNQEVVCLRYPDGQSFRIGLLALRRIVIYGEVDLSTAFLRAVEGTKVSLILLPARGKGNHVNLFPYFDKHFKLRQAQFQIYFDNDLRLSLARKVVAAKIQAQALWLSHHQLEADFSNALIEVEKAKNNATLMGIEGNVSKKYFAQWGKLWNKPWSFKGRNRRPPLDPVNALLSLSYTIAGNNIGQLACTYGLDPSLGFLHLPQRNRPSLMLDLLEPVRPWIDQWLWLKAQEQLFSPKQFTLSQLDGCRLNRTGRGTFFPAWYDDATNWLHTPMRDSLALLLGVLRKYSYPIS